VEEGQEERRAKEGEKGEERRGPTFKARGGEEGKGREVLTPKPKSQTSPLRRADALGRQVINDQHRRRGRAVVYGASIRPKAAAAAAAADDDDDDDRRIRSSSIRRRFRLSTPVALSRDVRRQ